MTLIGSAMPDTPTLGVLEDPQSLEYGTKDTPAGDKVEAAQIYAGPQIEQMRAACQKLDPFPENGIKVDTWNAPCFNAIAAFFQTGAAPQAETQVTATTKPVAGSGNAPAVPSFPG